VSLREIDLNFARALFRDQRNDQKAMVS
jgi:hypothetical protein